MRERVRISGSFRCSYSLRFFSLAVPKRRTRSGVYCSFVPLIVYGSYDPRSRMVRPSSLHSRRLMRWTHISAHDDPRRPGTAPRKLDAGSSSRAAWNSVMGVTRVADGLAETKRCVTSLKSPARPLSPVAKFLQGSRSRQARTASGQNTNANIKTTRAKDRQ